MAIHGEVVPTNGGFQRHNGYTQKYSPLLEREMLVGAQQLSAAREATLAVAKLRAESAEHLTGFVIDSFAKTKALIAEGDLPEEIAEMLTLDTYNSCVKSIKSGEAVSLFYDKVHEQMLDAIMNMHPADVEPMTIRRRVVDFLSFRESELDRYGIKFSTKEKFINGLTMSLYADVLLQRARQQARNSNDRY